MARKMKDSGIEWIGEIPEEWETCLYKYCCSVQPGYPFDSAKFSNSSTDGFPLIRIRDITSGEIQTYYTGEYPPNYIVTAGDLLVGMDGDFNVRWWNNDAALLNQRCCRVTEKDSVLRRFLYYVLPFTLQHINTLTYATTVKHLANGDILNSFIAFPSLPAQQNIVHYLDTVCSEIDAMLSKTRSSIEEYKKLKQSVITQAVTKGVRGEREMKDSEVDWIGEIPKEWSTPKIKRLHNGLTDGTHGTFNRIDSGHILLSSKNVREFGIQLGENESFISEADYNLITANGFPQKDDVLLCCIGASIGRCTLYEFEEAMAFQRSVIFIRCNSLILPRMMMYDLRSSNTLLQEQLLVNQSAQAGLYQGLVSEIFISLPPIGEQKEIIAYLDAKCAEIDRLIAKKEQLVKELEGYKKSLIYEVVTGKREV